MPVGKQSDERVMRRAITQLLMADLTERSGWREGVGFHTGLPEMRADMSAGESLVQRGVLTRGKLGTLRLSESAVVRALHVAVNAAVDDLLARDPPDASFAVELAEHESYAHEDGSYLVLCGIDSDEPGVR